MFSFVHFTDTHIAEKHGTPARLDRTVEHYYRHVVAEACGNGIDFIVNGGDLCSGGASSSLHERFKTHIDRLAEEYGVPYYVVKGGHESCMNGDKTTSFAEFERSYGESMYWLEQKGWAFLVLDGWQEWYRRMPMIWEDMSPEAMDVAREMLEEIPAGMPVVVFLHENPVGISGFLSGHMLLNVLKDYPVKCLLFGHVHANYISTYEGIPHACVVGEGSSFDSAPLTYNLVTCHDDGTVQCDFKPVRTRLPEQPRRVVSVAADAPIDTGPDTCTLRGDSGTRSVNAALPDGAPSCAWKRPLAGRVSAGCPKLVGGSLYVATQSRGRFDQCTVNAMSAESGETDWCTHVDGDVAGGLMIHGDRGYCGTCAGSLYCLALADGEIVWKWNNRENLPIACEPTLDEDGLLHFGANWEAYAVDAATGKTVWRTLVCPEGGISYFSPGNSSPLPLGNRIYHQRNFNGGTAGFSSLLQSLDRATGRHIQHSQAENFPGQRHASPVAWKDAVVAVGKGVYVFPVEDIATEMLRVPGVDSGATPAIEDDTAYVSGMEQIMACNLHSGEKLWAVPHEKALLYFRAPVKTAAGDSGYGNFSAPLVAADGVLVCDTAGNIRCFEKETGAERWRVNVGCPVLSAPTVSGNALYVCDYGGNVYAFAW